MPDRCGTAGIARRQEDGHHPRTVRVILHAETDEASCGKPAQGSTNDYGRYPQGPRSRGQRKGHLRSSMHRTRKRCEVHKQSGQDFTVGNLPGTNGPLQDSLRGRVCSHSKLPLPPAARVDCGLFPLQGLTAHLRPQLDWEDPGALTLLLAAGCWLPVLLTCRLGAASPALGLNQRSLSQASPMGTLHPACTPSFLPQRPHTPQFGPDPQPSRGRASPAGATGMSMWTPSSRQSGRRCSAG